MPTFTATLAQTVRVYGVVTVEADTMAAAIEQIRAHASAASTGTPMDRNLWDDVCDVDYSGATGETICSIREDGDTDPEGGLDDIELADDEGRIITADELRAAVEIA